MEQGSKAERLVLEVCRAAMVEGTHSWREIRSRLRSALSELPDAERQGVEFELQLMISGDDDQASRRFSH